MTPAATVSFRTAEASLAATWLTLRRLSPGVEGIYATLGLTALAGIALADGRLAVIAGIFSAHALLLWLLFLWLVRRNFSTPLARITAAVGGLSIAPESDHHAGDQGKPHSTAEAYQVRHLEEAVREMSHRVKYEFRTLVENAVIGVAILQDGRFRFANRAAAALVHLERPEDLVCLESALALLPEADRTRADRLGSRLQGRPGAHARIILPITGPGGSRRWIQMHLQQVAWRGRPGLMASLTDVSRQKHLEEDLRHLATHDVLTGAVNRRHFLDQAAVEIDRARRHKRPLALLLFDLDHFKNLNDSFGHATGDMALKQVTKSVWHHLREIDLVARIGGEEFAVLLPDTGLEGAIILAERLRHQIESLTIRTDTATVSVSVSIGVADGIGTHDETVSEALKRADVALYRAKREGRNRVAVAEPPRPTFAGDGI